MKLHWSPRSPFVRKVMVTAHELGITDRIERIRSVATVLKPHPGIMRDNPLSKIPTLVLDDGRVIYDSPVICEFLDLEFGTGRIVPREAGPRIDAMRREALGDGLLEILLLWRGERERAPQMRSPVHLSSYEVRTIATLDALERECVSFDRKRFDVGDLTIGCLLAYLDFRFPDVGWRTGRKALADWHAAVAERPSFRATPIVDDSKAS